MEVEARITAKRGLHARPVANLCSLAKKFDAQIWFCMEGGREVLASDILAVMGMNAKNGDTLKIRTEGREEEEAALEIKKFLENIED